VVTAGSTHVRAVGTEFDVYRREHDTVVTVTQGRVIVDTASEDRPHAVPSAAPLLTGNAAEGSASVERPLSAGQRLTIASHTVVQSAVANVAAATAWTQRRLVFASTPLDEVVHEFNRYNERPLVISDSSLSNFEIDGVFSSTDSTALLAFLRSRPEIALEEGNDRILIKRRP